MRDTSGVLYWVLAVLLIGFGGLAAFSVGVPFLAVGVALVALAPLRERTAVFWPALSAVIAFFAGYVLVAPLTCTAQAIMREGAAGSRSAAVGRTTCKNLIGIDYSGTGTYNPPLWPGVVAGVILAAVVAVGVWGVVRRSVG